MDSCSPGKDALERRLELWSALGGLAKSWRKGHEIKGFAGASWRRDGALEADAHTEAMLDDIPDYRFSQRNILYT